MIAKCWRWRLLWSVRTFSSPSQLNFYVDVGVALGGAGDVMGFGAILSRWRRTKTTYEILAAMVDPEHDPKRPWDWSSPGSDYPQR